MAIFILLLPTVSSKGIMYWVVVRLSVCSSILDTCRSISTWGSDSNETCHKYSRCEYCRYCWTGWQGQRSKISFVCVVYKCALTVVVNACISTVCHWDRLVFCGDWVRTETLVVGYACTVLYPCNTTSKSWKLVPRVGPGHPSSPFPIYFLIFSPFYFFLSFLGFTYFFFCPSLPFLPE